MKREYEPQTLEQRLGYLIEECGEVQAAAGKILRWGLNSHNPEVMSAKLELTEQGIKRNDAPHVHRAVALAHPGETNEEWLLRELRDLSGAIRRIREFLA